MQFQKKIIEFSQIIGRRVWYVDNQLVHDCIEFCKEYPEFYYDLKIQDVFKMGLITDIERNLVTIHTVPWKVSLVDTIPLDRGYTPNEIAAFKNNIFNSVMSAQRHIALGVPELYRPSISVKNPVVTDISSDGYSYSGRHYGDWY